MADVAEDGFDGELETPAAADEQGHPADLDNLSFGDDDAAPASHEERDTGLVRQLRQTIRDMAKRQAAPAAPDKAEDVGPKPTLESCEWDGDTFETKLLEYTDKVRKAASVKTKAQQETEAAQASWQSDIERYQKRKATVAAPDYQDAEDLVTSTLSEMQQSVVVQTADDPVRLIAALGRFPDKLAALSAIANPVKLAAAIVKLEGKLTVATTRSAPPAPERIARGGASVTSQGSDKQLDRLRDEAAKTGDFTKVADYKRKLAAKA